MGSRPCAFAPVDSRATISVPLANVHEIFYFRAQPDGMDVDPQVARVSLVQLRRDCGRLAGLATSPHAGRRDVAPGRRSLKRRAESTADRSRMALILAFTYICASPRCRRSRTCKLHSTSPDVARDV